MSSGGSSEPITGWDILTTPLAVHDPGQLAVLIQHPNPPAHFVRVETPLVSTPVYLSTNPNGMLPNTALPLNGVVTSMVAYDTMMTLETEDALAVVSGVRGQLHLHGVNPNTLVGLPDGRLLAGFLVVDFGYAEECSLRVVNGAVLYDPARQTYLLAVPPELLPAPEAAFPIEVQTRTFNVHVERGRY